MKDETVDLEGQPKWNDPAKKSPRQETLNIEGDFGMFTDLMRRIVNKSGSEGDRPKPASPGPVAT